MITNYQNAIPQELRSRPQWLTWFLDSNGSKIPNGKSNDAGSWKSFDEVSLYDRIAFVFSSDDPYTGIDLDSCRDPATGEIKPWAKMIVNTVNSYCEVSPSGTGVKIILRGRKPQGSRCTFDIDEPGTSSKKAQVEIYDQRRFWCITGQVLPGFEQIRDAQNELDEIIAFLALLQRKQVNTSKPRQNLAGIDFSEVHSSRFSGLVHRAKKYIDSVGNVAQGGRNNTAFSLAGHLLAMVGNNGERLSDCEIFELMHTWNAGNNPPLPENEIVNCVRSALSSSTPRADKQSIVCTTTMIDVATDDGNTTSAVKNSTTNEPDWNAIRTTYFIEESWTLSKLLNSDIEDRYLIDGMIVLDQPMVIAGPSKACKTTFATAIALCIASGKNFLHFKTNERRKVHFCSAESGKPTVKKTILGLAGALDIDLDELQQEAWITFDWWVPRSSNPELMAYFAHCVQACAATVSIIDPLYQTLDDQQASVIANGQQLADLGRKILSIGAMPIMLDHVKRSSENARNHQTLQLEDVTGAGKAEFFRQWALLGRRERFVPGEDGNHQHELWLTLGGSAGHASQWAFTIAERNRTPTDRLYELSLKSFSSHIESKTNERDLEKMSRQEERLSKYQKRIERKSKELIEVVYAGDVSLSLTRNDIKDRLTGVSGKEVGEIIGHCLTGKMLVLKPGSIVKNKKKFDGYMLADTIFSTSEDFQNE